MPYELYYHKRALKDLKQINAGQRKRIRADVERFARKQRGDVKLIRGLRPRTWELRAGPFRTAFTLREGRMEVLRVWRK